MATALLIAASSSARSCSRSSYCSFFSEQLSRSLERKSSKSAFVSVASLSCPLRAPKFSSLPPRTPCLPLYISVMAVCSAKAVFMNVSCASLALPHSVRASSRFALNVSRMSLRMPTTSPERAEYVPVNGSCMKDDTIWTLFLDTKADAATSACLTEDFNFARLAPLPPAMNCAWSAPASIDWSAPTSASVVMAKFICSMASLRSDSLASNDSSSLSFSACACLRASSLAEMSAASLTTSSLSRPEDACVSSIFPSIIDMSSVRDLISLVLDSSFESQ
mmetsp:Transcript_24117/g.81413  ORF Transcript_24117/g.81413 Transcript_24117/m.81413 type:complete len:278 (+) Transcript_24117:1272-2105(+)